MTAGTLPWAGDRCKWSVVPLRRRYDIRLGKMLQAERLSGVDTQLPYLKSAHVQWTGVQTDELPEMWASPSDRRLYLVQPGDLLVSEGGDVGRAAIVPSEVPPNTIIQNALHRVRADGRPLSYLAYVLRAVHQAGWFDVVCNKATIRHLTSDKLGALPIPDPPVDEQERIVAFLDREVTRLDEIARRKQQELALLLERRKRLISKTVAEGLDADPASPPRDAGLVGLSRVPGHWEVKALKWAGARVSVGIVIQPASYYTPDGDVPCIRGFNVRPARITQEDLVYISQASNAQLRKSALRQGDIVVVRTGQAGAAAVVPAWADGANCVDVLIVRQSPELYPKFLEYVINSDFAVEQVKLNSVGSIQAHFNVEAMKQLVVPVPPYEEQARIATWLDQRVDALDKLASTLQAQLTVIAGFRHALVVSAVTGVESPVPRNETVAA